MLHSTSTHNPSNSSLYKGQYRCIIAAPPVYAAVEYNILEILDVYLDIDGKTERVGPGWIDGRSRWEAWTDPLDLRGRLKDTPWHEKFWEQPERWAEVTECKN
jgi:hypothetical protein